ncbi:MAG: hypothetical protein WA354_20255 [Terracidiphilus sp.]
MASAPANNLSVIAMPNGPGAAAVLAAGIGCFTMGALSVLADKLPALARVLNIYRPTGPLSGVSTAAILVWVAAWALLHYCWRKRNVKLGPINGIAFLLLACGMLLTFPPIGDLF